MAELPIRIDCPEDWKKDKDFREIVSRFNIARVELLDYIEKHTLIRAMPETKE